MPRAKDIRHDARQLRVTGVVVVVATSRNILVLHARKNAVVHAKVSIVGNGFVLCELHFRGRSMKGTRDGDGLGVMLLLLLLLLLMMLHTIVEIHLHGRNW